MILGKKSLLVLILVSSSLCLVGAFEFYFLHLRTSHLGTFCINFLCYGKKVGSWCFVRYGTLLVDSRCLHICTA